MKAEIVDVGTIEGDRLIGWKFRYTPQMMMQMSITAKVYDMQNGLIHGYTLDELKQILKEQTNEN